MRPSEWSGDELVEALSSPVEPDVAGGIAVVRSGPDRATATQVAAAVARAALLPCVLIGTGRAAATPELVDVLAASDEEVAAVVDAVARRPLAALSLAQLLRSEAWRDVTAGLAVESSVFSTLQAGPEHRAWRAATPARSPAQDPRRDEPRVRVERAGAELVISLQRPHRANALDLAMRDELLAALAVAEADPDLRVLLRGDGAVFCSGGDLDEFGTAPDPATAHLVRLRRSIGAVLHRIAPRVTVHVQGACAGSGVELAAFAGHVVAHHDATFALPELTLGLVPGAGGTVSLPRRIGRHRTAWLALTGRTVDARTARSWGLVDEIDLF